MVQTLTERESKLFKKWLRNCLAYGPVTVIFTKKDGTERVMQCTTSDLLVPPPTEDPLTPKKEKKINEDVMPVYDIESKAWRSFRWDSIKQVVWEIK